MESINMTAPSNGGESGRNDDQSLRVTIGQSNSARVLLSENLFKVAITNKYPHELGNNPALSKPAFSPNGGKFVVGTEEQNPFSKMQNRLIFGQIDSAGKFCTNTDGEPTIWTAPAQEHIRDIEWVDNDHILFAMGSKLVLIRLGPDFNSRDLEMIMFPDFHKDVVREIAINERNKNLVISGGFDGNVFVTDIGRLVGDISKNETRSENSLYACRDVVGSVQWSATEPFLASCTTDIGVFHIFDIRTSFGPEDRRRAPLVFDTGRAELFTHDYRDANIVFLGYGDGSVEAFDIRMKKVFVSYPDPFQKMIGDIVFDRNKKVFAAFGYPEVTVWNSNETSINLSFHHMLSQPTAPQDRYMIYKTSGSFRPDENVLAVTDSNGMFAIFDVRH